MKEINIVVNWFLPSLFCFIAAIMIKHNIVSVSGENCASTPISCPHSLCKLKLTDGEFCKRIRCLGITPQSCPEGSEFVANLTMCNCCPGCAQYLDLGRTCSITDLPEMSYENCKGPVCAIRMNKCKRGLDCRPPHFTCTITESNQIDVPECIYKRTLSKLEGRHLHWEPKCELDGTYSPKQCKGSFFAGTCFCTNQNGQRIFGRELYQKAQNMTCACSRKMYELREAGYDSTLHCSSEGNFEPLQCDVEFELCYCVDPKTGLTNGAVVPANQWKSLPCYNRTFWGHDGHYLRQCESSWVALMKLKKEGRIHGLQDIYAGETESCEFDGSFASKQINNNFEICVFKNNVQIGSYREQQGVRDMDCRCARDVVLAKEEGRPFLMRCDAFGNYDIVWNFKQQQDDISCVDRDGFYYGDVTKKNFECCLRGKCPSSNNCTQDREKIKSCTAYVT